ncbi:E3 ubiquitin-protein ligase rnf152 [Engraulis encrasicolus]|uniref:E3 ubiquitin-protein ligase rnf152 n=1 Tax=Engraulis encrasicolus TaxID=184585 RepID=UPI002FD647DE
MANRGPDSHLECQICFHPYSRQRRPKLLGCGHTCCSVCLRRMCGSQCTLACPWCRALTSFPEGLLVSQLPDDPQALGFLAPRMPVFMCLPDDGCYLLPMAVEDEPPPPPPPPSSPLPGELATCLMSPGQKRVSVVTVAEGTMMDLEVGGGRVRDQTDQQALKQSCWTKVCTAILVFVILLLLLGIILQNITCVSRPFTIISCG